MGLRVVVLEANEIPPRLWRWYAERHPESTIATLLREAPPIETVNDDDLGDRELYPSQTWATLGTGVAYGQHGVYWYGDPKPEAYPLYWQLAARGGKTVGVVGTLHSSPLTTQCGDPGIVFAIPDCFATTPDTRPSRYRRFQQVNLRLTRGSGRTVAAKPMLGDAWTIARSRRLGVRTGSLVELAKLGVGVARRLAPRERLRNAQFILLAEMWEQLVRRHDPDLAVLFTNHVASAMHRYWYALFPDDWDQRHYDGAWIARYGGEIPYAMRMLDRALSRIIAMCDATDRVLVIATSMGQRAALGLDTSSHETAIVRDAERFVRALGVPGDCRVSFGMVPQLTLAFDGEASAQAAAAYLERLVLERARLWVDRHDGVLTLTYEVRAADRSFRLSGRDVSFADAGLIAVPIDDHRSGDHDPVGALIIRSVDQPRRSAPIDVRRVAPTVLSMLGVAPAPYHEPALYELAGTRVVTA